MGTPTLSTQEGRQRALPCPCRAVAHLQASSFDRLEHAAVGRVLLVDSVQEVHFDDVLRNGVLETVKHLAPVAQRHVLLVQLGTEQTHSCCEAQLTLPTISMLEKKRSPRPNGLLSSGAGMSILLSEAWEMWVRCSLGPHQSSSYSLERSKGDKTRAISQEGPFQTQPLTVLFPAHKFQSRCRPWP